MPITYMNSTAAIKDFCGRQRRDGLHEFERGQGAAVGLRARRTRDVLPRPAPRPQHGLRHGHPALERMPLWDPARIDGGASADDYRRASSSCGRATARVHQKFDAFQIEQMRAADPETASVLVHPECNFEVVQGADLVGTTEFIIRPVEEAPPGSKWAIGTEFHLVTRLADQHPGQGDLLRQRRSSAPARRCTGSTRRTCCGRWRTSSKAMWSTRSGSAPRWPQGRPSRWSACWLSRGDGAVGKRQEACQSSTSFGATAAGPETDTVEGIHHARRQIGQVRSRSASRSGWSAPAPRPRATLSSVASQSSSSSFSHSLVERVLPVHRRAGLLAIAGVDRLRGLAEHGFMSSTRPRTSRNPSRSPQGSPRRSACS